MSCGFFDSMINPVQKSRAKLSGTVTDTVFNIPKAYAVVALDGQKDTTDASGHFILDDLEVGHKTLEAMLSGYKPLKREIKLEEGGNVTDVSMDTVSLVTPALTITPNRKSGKVPLQIQFSLAADPESVISYYTLELGDGVDTTLVQLPGQFTHTYSGADTVVARLKVSNFHGQEFSQKSDTIFLAVNQKPVVNLIADDSIGKKPFTVTFICNASDADGSIQNLYEWIFPDTTPFLTQSSSYQYTFDSSGQNQPVAVRVFDNDNASNIDTLLITVLNNTPPFVKIKDFYPPIGKKPLAVNFVAEFSDPDGEVVFFYWDFGDGSNEPTEIYDSLTSHLYIKEGAYSVYLFAVDNDGGLAQSSRAQVSVQP